MKSALLYFWRAHERAVHRTDRHHWPVGGQWPAPGEVLGEIGLILAIQLAIVFAVIVALRMAGIA